MIFFSIKESETILERYRRRNLDNLLELHNKTPVWNDGMRRLILSIKLVQFRFPPAVTLDP